MSIPKKHHYLPQFFMQRWAGHDGVITEYRHPHNRVTMKRKVPSETGYIEELYSDESKSDPIERQALELVFLQRIDSKAAECLRHLETQPGKPLDPVLRDSWSRFLMSLMHRSPERVKWISEKVRKYEQEDLTPLMETKYLELRTSSDPPDYQSWLAEKGEAHPELRVKLLKMIIDNKRIGETLNNMQWQLSWLPRPRHGFLTGDQPLMMSDGIGHPRGFVALPVGPDRVFVAANDKSTLKAFASAPYLELAMNDACTRQSRHVIIARDDSQRRFVENRFIRQAVPAGSNGYVSWNIPEI